MKFSWHVFAIKITSRKLWVALAGLATAIMAYLNCNSNTVVQVSAIIGALGAVVGYLIANGLTEDGAADSGTTAAAETGDAAVMSASGQVQTKTEAAAETAGMNTGT